MRLSLPKSTLESWLRAFKPGKLERIGSSQRPLTEMEVELALVRMASTLRCWRLYSCSRFTWMSKRVSGSTTTPVRSWISAARSALLARLTFRHSCWNTDR